MRMVTWAHDEIKANPRIFVEFVLGVKLCLSLRVDFGRHI